MLIAISLSIAILFLDIFYWNMKSGQYDDAYTPSVSILFDNKTCIAGDLLLHFYLRKMSGLVSAACILCYFATVATLIVKQKRRYAKVL